MSFCSVGSQRVIVIELSEGTVWVCCLAQNRIEKAALPLPR
jgi:hypothetical protein